MGFSFEGRRGGSKKSKEGKKGKVALGRLAANEHSLTILLKFQSASDCDR